MAKPYVRTATAEDHSPAVDSHGIRIVDQQSLRRAKLINIAANIKEDRDGAQAT
jgi:hypothetical protein